MEVVLIRQGEWIWSLKEGQVRVMVLMGGRWGSNRREFEGCNGSCSKGRAKIGLENDGWNVGYKKLCWN